MASTASDQLERAVDSLRQWRGKAQAESQEAERLRKELSATQASVSRLECAASSLTDDVQIAKDSATEWEAAYHREKDAHFATERKARVTTRTMSTRIGGPPMRRSACLAF